MRNKKYAIISVVIIVILLLFAGLKLFIDDEYKAQHSLEYYKSKTDSTITIDDNLISTKNEIITKSDMVNIGIIIYSAEKIQREAYIPLMTELSDYGYQCFLPTASGNIPLLNIDGANSVIQNNGSIELWIMVGHSYGADSAARFVSSHQEISGLVMLAGRGTRASKLENIKILSIIGSEDGVIDFEQYNSSKAKFLSKPDEKTILGGNHTYFADAELVLGDSEASVTVEQQISQTAALIDDFVDSYFLGY